MATELKVKKVCAGLYHYTSGGKTVEVEKIDPNPAYRDTKPMWIAVAQWDSGRYSDPMDTKREAVVVAHSMLNGGGA